MRRFFFALVLLVAAGILLPPLYYAIFPVETPELPPAGRRIPVAEGVAVNTIERGAGRPVVLIHGLPGTGYDWAPLTEALDLTFKHRDKLVDLMSMEGRTGTGLNGAVVKGALYALVLSCHRPHSVVGSPGQLRSLIVVNYWHLLPPSSAIEGLAVSQPGLRPGGAPVWCEAHPSPGQEFPWPPGLSPSWLR